MFISDHLRFKEHAKLYFIIFLLLGLLMDVHWKYNYTGSNTQA